MSAPESRPPILRLAVDVANLMTLTNTLVGLASILAAIERHFSLSLVLIVIAVHIDHADGAVARSLRKRPEGSNLFGAQLDSLSDLINFGLAPAIAVVLMSGRTIASYAVGIVLVCAATLRLAYFNVFGMEGPYFRGLTTTYAGFLFSVAGLLALRQFIPYFVFHAVCIAAAVLEVSSFRLRKYGYSHWYVLGTAGIFAVAAFMTGAN